MTAGKRDGCRHRHAGADRRWSDQLDLPSWPSRAGLARAQPMAVKLAVA
jgi:hypothetical protein